MNLLQSVFNWQWRSWGAMVAFGLVFLFARVLFPAATAKSGGPNNVVDLQKAYTPQMFREVLRKWSQSKNDAVGIVKRENIVKVDSVFPLIYGLFFAFLYASVRGTRAPGSLDILLFSLPLVAALCDWTENGLHLYLLRGVNTASQVESAQFSSTLVFAASFFAYTKYLLLANSLVSAVVVLILRVKNFG